ncbi:MAG: hypothetical protein NTX01_08935 [Candidatus Omnitrophica bacterium]|nr:hypothetical protein [Candidatus Omnitrophota bacterium]
MSWVINLIFWLIAFSLSLFWGFYGCKVTDKYIKKLKDLLDWKNWKNNIEPGGIFLSEFIGSFAGWCCFYIFIYRIQYRTFIGLNGVDVFLIIGAVIGMAGYSYKIAEVVKKLG